MHLKLSSAKWLPFCSGKVKPGVAYIHQWGEPSLVQIMLYCLLNQCWPIVSWTFKSKLQWNQNENRKYMPPQNTLKDIICNMATILFSPPGLSLTHWSRVTHICVGKLTIIGSDNGLSPGWCQAIIGTNAGILLIGPLRTNFSEILNRIQIFS